MFLNEDVSGDVQGIFSDKKTNPATPDNPLNTISVFRTGDIHLFAVPAVSQEGALVHFQVLEAEFTHKTYVGKLKFDTCNDANCMEFKHSVLTKVYDEYKASVPQGQTAKTFAEYMGPHNPKEPGDKKGFLDDIEKLYVKVDVGEPGKKAYVHLTETIEFKPDKTPMLPIKLYDTLYSGETSLPGQKIASQGKHELKLQLYKDLDGNDKYEITDQAIQYENNDQIHSVGYEILPSPNDGCRDRPRIHVVWPRENTYCREDLGIKIKAIVWDDCNEVTVTWSAKSSKTGNAVGSGGSLTKEGIYYTGTIPSTNLDLIGSDEEMILVIKADDSKAVTEQIVNKIKVSQSGADCTNV